MGHVLDNSSIQAAHENGMAKVAIRKVLAQSINLCSEGQLKEVEVHSYQRRATPISRSQKQVTAKPQGMAMQTLGSKDLSDREALALERCKGAGQRQLLSRHRPEAWSGQCVI